MTEPNKDGRWPVKGLLHDGFQVWPNMSEDEFDSLCAVVKTAQYAPVLVSEDAHRMYDGHQRCLALLANARKEDGSVPNITIPADKVVVMKGVNEKNIWMHAIAANSVRAKRDSYDKAQVMHWLYAKGKSQSQIAGAFKISQPAVSQLMSQYPADESIPKPSAFSEGADGKSYIRDLNNPEPKEPKDPKQKIHPWVPGGSSYKQIHQAFTALDAKWVTGLKGEDAMSAYHWDLLGSALGQLQGAVNLRMLEIQKIVKGVDPESDDEDWGDE